MNEKIENYQKKKWNIKKWKIDKKLKHWKRKLKKKEINEITIWPKHRFSNIKLFILFCHRPLGPYW